MEITVSQLRVMFIKIGKVVSEQITKLDVGEIIKICTEVLPSAHGHPLFSVLENDCEHPHVF